MKIIKNLLLVLTLLFVTSCKEDTFMKDYPQLEDKKHIYEVVEIDRVLEIFEKVSQIVSHFAAQFTFIYMKSRWTRYMSAICFSLGLFNETYF